MGWAHRTAALAVALVLVGCGSSGSDDAVTTEPESTMPAACVAPPVTVDLQAGGAAPAGSASFEVTDAVARRVPILPGQMAFDPAELSGLESEAGITPLALYTLYLADFEIPRDALTGAGFGDLAPGPDQTLGTLTLVPVEETGLATGDVVADGEISYELTTSFRPLTLTVFGDEDPTPQAYTDVVGQVEVLHLGDDSICVDMDVTLEDQGEAIYTARGVILVPVVRAADSFFFT